MGKAKRTEKASTADCGRQVPLAEFTSEKLRSLAREGVELRRQVAREYRSPLDVEEKELRIVCR